MSSGLRVFYSCRKCPAYCCSYPRIRVTPEDLERLAGHHGIGVDEARTRFTKKGQEPGERVLRHRHDHVYDSVCRFLDRETRSCTVYAARPEICRDYPGGVRCGYYDFLAAERRLQEDPEFIPSA